MLTDYPMFVCKNIDLFNHFSSKKNAYLPSTKVWKIETELRILTTKSLGHASNLFHRSLKKSYTIQGRGRHDY